MRGLPVGVIGAGRVGVALTEAMVRADYRVTGIVARSDAAMERVRLRLPQVPVLDPLAVAESSELLLLTVPDDAIAPVCGNLADGGRLRKDQYVMHASGACGLRVLNAASAVGATPLAIHPAMTFPGLSTDAENLPGLAYAVTSSVAERTNAEDFVRDLGGVPVWVAEANRTLYHASLVLGANNLITLAAAAMQGLAAAGISDPGFVLGPLVRASLENALRVGDEALTGPVRRADTGTIQAHIHTLRERVPDLVPSYLQFALITATRAGDAALNTTVEIDRVVDLLRAELSKDGSGTII